jgi:asparagine synthase (glutamine-hydrolysing)
MPGIVGILQAGHQERPHAERLAEMVLRLQHGSHHRGGQFNDSSHACHVGWIWDAAVAEHETIHWNGTRTIGVVFSGEDYSGSIHEFLLRYEEVGVSALGLLNGCFSGLILDQRLGRQILFNDRYGLGRVYYHRAASGFHFASEAKALLALFPALRVFDQRGLAEFFSVGCALQNRTLFQDLLILPPGSAWTFHGDGRTEKQQYFKPAEWEGLPALNPAEYAEELVTRFRHVMPRYLGSPGNQALSMTGGLDSRMILAWAGSTPDPLPCYTFAGPYRECADLRIAKELCQIAGSPHHTLSFPREYFDNFPALAEKSTYLSDGAMDVSGSVELLMNQQAREIAPIRLTGNYGSEILRSNVAFRPAKLDRSIFTAEFQTLLEEAEHTYRTESQGNRLSFIAFKQVPWHHYARRSIETSQLTPRSPFLDNDLVRLAFQVPTHLATSPEPLLHLIHRGSPKLAEVPSDRGLRYSNPTFFNRVARSWHEFTAKAEYAYDYGMPPWLNSIDRRLAPLHLERLFLGRHKFYHFRVWYRDQLGKSLRSWVTADLDRLGCYREGAAKQLIQEHVSGRANKTSELHKLLTVTLTDRGLIGLR